MSKVFLGGSRSASRLSAPVRERIENILSQGFDVVVGDASGADRAFQSYLAERGYANVTVFCSGSVCRNNLGNWKTTHVPTGRNKLDFQHYARKDAQMAGEADYGFFLWNGKSRGTLNSILMLLQRQRPALVYLSPKRRFITLKQEADLVGILSEIPPEAANVYGARPKKSDRPTQQALFGHNLLKLD